jgi:hypothetical protein
MAAVDGCLRDQCADQLEEARAQVLSIVCPHPFSSKVFSSTDHYLISWGRFEQCAQIIADDSTYIGVRNSGGPLTSTSTSTTVEATTTATLISATTIDARTSSIASVSSEIAASASRDVESVS